jgi:hypothetical protein
MKGTLFFLLLLFFLLPQGQIMAQDSPADSALLQQSITKTRNLFTQSIGINAYLYNGTTYARYWNGVVGLPFFEWDNFRKGSLNYYGVPYDSVQLKYDLFGDALVTKAIANDAELKLIPDKVNTFSIGNHHFQRLVADSMHHSDLSKTGFYEILYSGRVQVFVRHEKRIEKSMQVGDNFSKFMQYDTYFIEKEDRFYLINSESDLLSVFKDQKAEIKKILKKKDSGFKKHPETAIVEVAAFYDQVKK